MTLVTCTPLGINSERILVTGERILPTPHKDVTAANKPASIEFPWWMLQLAAALILASAYVWLSGRPVKPRTGGAS